MLHLPRPKSVHHCNQVNSHSEQASRKVNIMADHVVGDYLDEFLICTNKPNTWVWVPKADFIGNSFNNNCLTLRLYQNQEYSAAELQIANAIRLYLTNHQMIKGKDIRL